MGEEWNCKHPFCKHPFLLDQILDWIRTIKLLCSLSHQQGLMLRRHLPRAYPIKKKATLISGFE